MKTKNVDLSGCRLKCETTVRQIDTVIETLIYGQLRQPIVDNIYKEAQILGSFIPENAKSFTTFRIRVGNVYFL